MTKSSVSTIARYVPVTISAVLVVAWIVSVIASIGVIFNCPVDGAGSGRAAIALHLGRLMVWYSSGHKAAPTLWMAHYNLRSEILSAECLGRFKWRSDPYSDGSNGRFTSLCLPFLLMLTLLLPLGTTSFSRFRFPLWFLFAWTALIAVECAIYVRFPQTY